MTNLKDYACFTCQVKVKAEESPRCPQCNTVMTYAKSNYPLIVPAGMHKGIDGRDYYLPYNIIAK